MEGSALTLNVNVHYGELGERFFGVADGGLTQRQAGLILGVPNGAPISRQLRKLARDVQSNRLLRDQVAGIAEELKHARNPR